ncbi:anthranilate phosphoribosyltransferase [Pseudoalteromonas xiamenensis]|uniref:anthranilate phosphoribosyltransferase n=1 Tax=Pseudoalteromonas xiamenensis TaxID=882626 RepID=UPI0027E44C7E|nr:anthranilate phosphoribosyltransferase [Pseudoalteromonas xiamenensis]WMN59841.1 anthranilate phosphoribosyltransferase [Pseudoalteromonas xiamenensis]
MDILNNLLKNESLNFEQSQTLFDQIMQGSVSDIELTAALVALKLKGETVDEIAGAAASMRKHAIPFNAQGLATADSCGTGGDGSNTINVSTTAAIVGAACGIPMVKHGNRSVSSKSGSADLLKSLGINIDMSPSQAETCLQETGFTFLFAPLYHQGVKHAMPVRTALKTRTIFNILGPLANPAQPDIQLLGVYDAKLCLPMAQTLQKLGTKRAMVVHGAGTDEIALHGKTVVAELKNGVISEYELAPDDFGLANYSLESIAGDTPDYNAQASVAILSGQGLPAHNAAIAANVAALLYMQGRFDSLNVACDFVLSTLESGQAIKTLELIKEVSHG